MKQLSAAALSSVVLLLLFSCKSVDPHKRYPNMVADADPVSAGVIDAEFDRLFSSKLNKIEIEVIFYPRLNSVALEFRYEFIKYRQFWDDMGRKQFANAVEMYKEDYAARKLVTKYNKSRAVYGKVKSRVEWESFKFSKTHVSTPTIEIGYRFREETPFFATLMRSAREEDSSNDSPMDSQQINMYFTRAQAEELVKLFDQSFLLGLLEKVNIPKIEEPTYLDEYREYGDD